MFSCVEHWNEPPLSLIVQSSRLASELMSEQLKLKSNPLRPLHCSIAVYTKKLFHSIEISVRDRHSSIVNQIHYLSSYLRVSLDPNTHTHTHAHWVELCAMSAYFVCTQLSTREFMDYNVFLWKRYLLICTLSAVRYSTGVFGCTHTDANKTMDPSRETKTTSEFVQKLSSIDFELKASDNTSCAATTDNRVAGDETQFRLSRGTTDASK